MILLIGRYEYALDVKNRVGLPPKFREALAQEKAKAVYLTSGLENCLYLFLPSQWSQLLEKDLSAFSLPDKEQERAFKRKFFAEATEAELDSAGRILIPQFLREHARLGKNVLIQGAGKRAEIWDKDKWNSYKKSKVEPAYRLVTKSIEI
ncbi:MAG TPA: division/cell wall cluster transcriptional repressor MraZ [Elusimicrobiota bacterium]|nr:division/cell wall cluster transcriptional repressor MraZ [Elusimicrobiota bacterium]